MKHNKTLQWRNKEIYATFLAHLRNGHPTMVCYAILARDYDLSEESVRKIIREQAQS